MTKGPLARDHKIFLDVLKIFASVRISFSIVSGKKSLERFFAIDFEEPKFRIFKIFFYLIISNTLENDILMGAKIFKIFEKKILGISKVSANQKASTYFKKVNVYTYPDHYPISILSNHSAE